MSSQPETEKPISDRMSRDLKRIEVKTRSEFPLLEYYLSYMGTGLRSTTPVSAHRDTVITLIGKWGWGVSSANVPFGNSGDTLLIGNGWILQVLDISAPEVPLIVGEVFLTGPVFDISVSGTTAYVAMGEGIEIIDLTNPEIPVVIGMWDQFRGIDAFLKVLVSGTIAFVGSFYATYTLDISDPKNIRFLDWMTNAGHICTGIELLDPYLFVSTHDGLIIDIFDVSNPSDIVLLDYQFGPASLVFDLTLSDTLLFAGTTINVHIYSLSDAERPVEIAFYPVSSPAHGLTVVDTVMYIAEREGLHLAGISNPSDPSSLAKIQWPYYDPSGGPSVGKITVSKGFAHLSVGTGLWTVDIKELHSLKDLGSFWTSYVRPSEVAEGIALLGEKAYVPMKWGGVWEIDISDPENPDELRHLVTLPEWASDVAVEENLLYVVAGSELKVVDIQDPDSFKVIGNWEASNQLEKILLRAPLIFTTRADSGLYVIDVSDPESPTEVSFMPTGYVTSIRVNEYSLYVATERGVNLIDVYDPPSPNIEWTWSPSEVGPMYVANMNTKVFSIHQLYPDRPGRAMTVLDFSLPLNPPVEIGSLDLPPEFLLGAINVKAEEPLVVAASDYRLLILDASNISDLSILLGFETLESSIPGTLLPLAVENDLIYTGAYGFSVFRLSESVDIKESKSAPPFKFKLYPNYPNPFNEGTLIKYDLAVRSNVSLDVHNLLGMKIRTLVGSEQGPGSRNVVWDGKDGEGIKLPSGIYVYRLTTGGNVKVGKMVLLR